MKKRILAMILTVCLIMGLLPTSALAVDGEKRITAADAIVNGQTYDWLNNDDVVLEINDNGSFLFSISGSVADNNWTDRTLIIELKQGLQWESYNSPQDPSPVVGESDKVVGFTGYDSGYDCKNGSVTFEYDTTTTGFSISGSIKADTLLFTGHETLIKDAVKLTYSDSGLGDTPETYSLDVRITENVPKFDYNHNRSDDENYPGKTSKLVGGFYKDGGSLFEELTFSITLPEGFTMEAGYPKFGGKLLTAERTEGTTSYYKVTNSGANNLEMYVKSDADSVKLEKTYQTCIGDITYKPYTPDGSASSYTIESYQWQLKVVEEPAEEFTYSIEAERGIHNVNWTKYGNQTHNFTDYQTELARTVVKVTYQDKAPEDLYYEYTVDASSATGVFVNRVNIPCSYGNGNEYLPTIIKVTDSAGKTHTLLEDKIAALPGYSNKNGSGSIFLRASDIPLQEGVSIIKVEAQIPRFYGNGFSHVNGNAGANNGSEVASVWGYFGPGEVGGTITTTLRPVSETAETPYEARTAIQTVTANSQQISTTSDIRINDQKVDSFSLLAGESAEITFNTYHQGMGYRYGSRLSVDPEFYVFLPPGMSATNIKLISTVDNVPTEIVSLQKDHTAQITAASPSTGWGEGWTCLKITPAQPQYVTGVAAVDGKTNDLALKFTLVADQSASLASYNFQNIVQYRTASGLSHRFYVDGMDPYGINNGKAVNGTKVSLNVLDRGSVSIDVGFRMEGEPNYYSYNKDDPNTQAAFSLGKRGEMRINLYNGMRENLSNIAIYVPIPKKGQNLSPISGYFQSEAYGFDMSSAEVTSYPEGWQLEYGTMTNIETDGNELGYSTPPTLKNQGAACIPTHNMIKLTYTGTLAPKESARFLISYDATNDPRQSDSSNLFRPMIIYQESANTSAPKVQSYAWAGLQSGVIDGTVYVDVDRDSTYDEGTDTPVRDAVVTVQGEDGSFSRTNYTSEDGTYKFEGLPANKSVTVTITSPYSNNPSDANAYRIVTTGSLTAAEDGKSGSTSPLILSSTDGQATINAALVAPYTITFTVTDGMKSVVIPPSLRRFEGQTIGDYNTPVNVVTVAGEQFDGTWSQVDGGGSPISSDELLNQRVTGNTTYTAAVSKIQYKVAFAGWAPSGTYTKLLDKPFEYNDTLIFTPQEKSDIDDDAMRTKNPGYRFLGWREDILGDGELLQLSEIQGKQVTSNQTYYAQYELRKDISVTLDANGGTFTGDRDRLLLENLTYGKTVNEAPDYEEPKKASVGGDNFYFVGWAETAEASTGSSILNVPPESGKTYYAIWAEGEPTKVTVSFDRGGGQWTTGGAEKYGAPLEGKPGETLVLPTADDITRTGYTLGGWYTDKEFTAPAGETYPIGNQTLYAKWIPNKHTITYDLNHGNVNGNTDPVVQGNVDYDSTLIDVPDAVRAGYTLIGWMVTAPAEHPAYGYIIPVDNMTTRKVDGDITYTAQWSANAVSVKFHANPTSVSDAAFSDGVTEKTFSNAYGSAMPFADVPAPVRPGYTFKGWVTNDDGTGQIQSGSFTFNGATTDYYAQWEATKVTVTFNPNGGQPAEPKVFTLNYGENHPTGIPTVTLAGSQLAYWLDMETGKKYAKDAEAEIEAFPTGAVTKDKTYLAIWNTVQYTVTFMGYDANSGNKEIPTVYDGTPAAPAVIPPAGQVFKHWEVTASTDADVTVGATYTSEALLNIKVRGDITFEAVFEPADVTITYIATPGAWGGGETTKTISGQSGTAIGAQKPADPTREGYTFADWSETLTEFPTVNTTLTASWTAKTYTITFDKNVGTDGKPGTAGSESVTVTGTYDKPLSELISGTIPTGFTPSGYTFVGWEDENGAIYPVIDNQIVRGKATYTAYFTSSEGNTVTFHANKSGESGANFPGDGTTKAYQITTAADFSVNDVPLPVWAEHTFVKWVDAEGQDAPATLTFANTANGKDYYAEYETTTYTVTFNYNGGKDDTSSTGPKEITGKTLNETVAEGEVPVLTLEGKNFLGWLNLNDNQTYKTAAEVAAVQITADTSYIALWDTQTFDVTYQGYNQGQPGDTAVIPTVYGQPPAAPAVIPNGGYAFDYWLVVKPSGGVTVGEETGKKKLTADELANLKVTQPITLKAIFKATNYKVTFDANGGTFGGGGTAPTYSVAYNQVLSTADGFTAPTVSKSGAKFLGWTKAGDGTLYTNGVDDPNYIGKVVITGDTVFIASWSGDVRVTFNANGGTITGSDYAEGQTGTEISVPTPTRYGYNFGGWYTESSCENSAMTDGTYKFPATTATWYAKWTAKNVTVIFDYGEGQYEGNGQKEITKAFDSKLSEADIPAPTLAGFTLTGWSREDGTIIPNANMTSEVINTEGTVTYTAYYTANPITITFDPNGGTFPDGTTQDKSYMKSEGDTMPFADVPVPALATKTFAGWKLEGAEDSTAATTGDMTFDSAKTYVAVWKDAQYTITFRLNGGSVSGSSDDVVIENLSHGTTFPAIPDVTLSGNTLQGWMNMEDGQMYGGTNTAFPTTVTESATYIAIWGTNTYDVTFTKYDYSDQSTGDSSSLTIPTIYEGIPAAPTVTPPTGKQFANWKITSGSLKGESGNLEVGAAVTSAELTKCQVIGHVTLEAQYSDPSYTVTFNPGEGATISSGESSYTVVNGGKLTEVPTATKDGATSTSWICSLNGKAMTAEEIKNLVIHSDVTFTAVWVGDVTVSFVLNGGHITNDVPASVTGAPGTEVTVPLVSQESYTFDGWYDAEDGGNPVTFTGGKTTIGNTSVTYYARWTQNTLTVESSTITKPYTGTPEVLEWKVTDSDNNTLTTDDYSVSYFHRGTGVVTVNEVPTDAGTYTVTIRGKGSYAGQTVTAEYIIEQADLSSATVQVTDNSKIYNGSAQYATVSVTVGNNALVMGRDFTVTYGGDCINAGSYSITVTGMGNYKGEVKLTKQLTIDPKALSDDMIQPIPDQHYTGQPIEPEITVQDGDLALHADVDFENVTYQNHTAVGNQTASVTITGMGNYSGTATAYFSIIAKATNLEVSLSEASATYGDDLSGMTITVKADGTALTAGQDYQISYQRYDQNGALEDVDGIDQAGVYIITAEGLDNYAGSKGSAVFVLNPKSESDGALVINQSNSEWVYDGANHLPTGIVVKWNDTDELTEGVDYTLSYSYNGAADQPLTADTQFIDAGVYVVTAKAQGNYAGTASFVVTITPKNVSDADVTVIIPETTYNAGARKADITVTDLRTPLDLVLDQDYTVGQDTYTNANEAGYEIVITGTGNYFGSRTERFVIQKATITVTADPVSVGYGDSLPEISAINPVISGIIEADKEDVTVTLEWPSDVNVGEHTLAATLSGAKAGNYVADTTGAPLTITPKNMNGENSGVTAVLEPNYSYYNGAVVTPNVVVTDETLGTTLVNGTDYTVTYKNSKGETVEKLVEVGSYTVTVTGTGNYTGTFELVYSINNRPSGGGGGTIRYTIEATAGRGGTITPAGETSVRDGGKQTFQIIPDEGYSISIVLVDGKNVGAVSSYTFEDVSDNHTIEAMFAQTDSKLTFVDVPAGSYYYDAVYWAVEHDITNGTGGNKFSPDAVITRAQMVTFLWRVYGAPKVTCDNPFTDVDADAYYYDAVLWAVSNGVTKGTSATTFSPDLAVTRSQAVTFQWRASGAVMTSGESFSDVPEDVWYTDAVTWAAVNGITKGTSSTTFSPDMVVSRAQVVTFLYRELGSKE